MGFEIGNSYPLINPVMDIMGERLRIVKQQIDINSPQNSSMTIGDKFKSLLDYQLEQQEVEQRVLTLQKELSRSSRQVTQLGTAYGFISSDIQGIQTTLQNSDVENLPQHLQAIEDQLAAIQRELEQIEPPPSGGGDGDGGGSGIKYFPVDYTRSGINFWTGMQYDMGFGRRSSGDWHAGYDIGGGGTGHPVYAIASGTVTAASYVGGWGNRITIQHSTDNYHTLYAHLASMDVVVGQTVEAGQRIGMMGASGGNYAIHLHVELSETGLFDDGNTIDPAPYLGVIADNTTSLPNPG